MPSIEMSENPFSEITQEFLRSEKVTAACDTIVKNRVMGAH